MHLRTDGGGEPHTATKLVDDNNANGTHHTATTKARFVVVVFVVF